MINPTVNPIAHNPIYHNLKPINLHVGRHTVKRSMLISQQGRMMRISTRTIQVLPPVLKP